MKKSKEKQTSLLRMSLLMQFVRNMRCNQIAGIAYFDEPLFGCADANDGLFRKMKSDPAIYGDFFRLPVEWMSDAKTVVSIFFPYSKQIRDSNKINPEWPSNGWLHGRIEGHAFLAKTIQMLVQYLQDKGFKALAPTLTDDFAIRRQTEQYEKGWPPILSNWSERHVAFVAGLGTFGLSKHLITEKGVCGRFGSIITDAEFEITPRPYSDPFEYCTNCGICARQCPIQAIQRVQGALSPDQMSQCKDNRICSRYIGETKALFNPRYGCGKCELMGPCETGIPRKSKKK